MRLHLAKFIAFATILCSCGKPPVTSQADVIVVGAGIAGLSAALEASAAGADVVVLDANSVGGGHAVKAGGFALVDTALQREKGINDSPLLAAQDMLAWGETANPEWVERYAQASGTEVYDWLVGMGVEFRMVLPTPESSVARFHFTRGTAVHAVLPMLREALQRGNIRFLWNTAANELLMTEGQVIGVHARNVRTGTNFQLYGGSVVLATGGFQSNRTMVEKYWQTARSRPGRLLIGSGQFALGDGYRLAEDAGAELRRMNQQVTFVNGIPDPRDADRQRGLTVTNKRAMLINADGQRFVDETLPSKQLEQAVFARVRRGFWMVFDAKGARKLGVRGAAWLTTDTVRDEIIQNPELTVSADSPEALAALLELPVDNVLSSFSDYNSSARKPIVEPPYYALQLYPLTRKSMGGPAISSDAQVVQSNGDPVKGLYAAGELTGVAGINGSWGGSGTFLGPSVFTGRIAGKAAAANSSFPLDDPDPNVTNTPRLDTDIDGYWHYTVVHDRVRDEARDCDSCHKTTPMAEVGTNQQMLSRLDTCLSCH